MPRIHFVHPWVLLLLWSVPLVVALAAWIHGLRKRRLAALVSARMQGRLLRRASSRRLIPQTALWAIGLALALLAAARPQWGLRDETVYRHGRELAIVLDVSRSMLADDVYPNRLLRAKADLADLLEHHAGDRTALVAFRHRPVVVCPMTTDAAFLATALEGIDVDSAPPGETDIGAALAAALDALGTNTGPHRAIVLVSDGEDLAGGMQDAIGMLHERGVPLFTVGLGDPAGSKIPAAAGRAAYLVHDGEDIVTRLEGDRLREAARATGGAYLPIGTAGMSSATLGDLYNGHMRRVERRAVAETMRRRRIERYQAALLPAVICLLCAAALSPGRYRGGRQATGRLAAAGLVLLACAGPGRAAVRDPGRAFRQGLFDEAAQAYLETARAVPSRRSRLRYNAAVSLYHAGRYGAAADLLRDLARVGGEPEARVSTALGCALFRAAAEQDRAEPAAARERLRLLTGAGEAFRQALRHDARSDEARANLSLVLERLPRARQSAHRAELLRRCATLTPVGLTDSVLRMQRQLTHGLPRAFTNTTPAQLELLEKFAVRQRRAADLWLPVRHKLAAAARESADEDFRRRISDLDDLIPLAAAAMTNAAGFMAALEPEACDHAMAAERNTYLVWKALASPSMLVCEALDTQTNAISAAMEAADAQPGPALLSAEQLQEETLRLTGLVGAKLEAAPEPVSGLSEIRPLLAEALTLQSAALAHIRAGPHSATPGEQQRSWVVLDAIRRLLAPPAGVETPAPGQEPAPAEPQAPRRPGDAGDAQADTEEGEPHEMSADELSSILERALQREQEHAQDLQRRRRGLRPAAGQRDW